MVNIDELRRKLKKKGQCPDPFFQSPYFNTDTRCDSVCSNSTFTIGISPQKYNSILNDVSSWCDVIILTF